VTAKKRNLIKLAISLSKTYNKLDKALRRANLVGKWVEVEPEVAKYSVLMRHFVDLFDLILKKMAHIVE
jgi:hypothetical protein